MMFMCATSYKKSHVYTLTCLFHLNTEHQGYISFKIDEQNDRKRINMTVFLENCHNLGNHVKQWIILAEICYFPLMILYILVE
jgi:hypothetical protein